MPLIISLADIARVAEGALVRGGPANDVHGVAINSRAILPGELFIAIKGKKHDGHRFLPEAFKRGAAAAVVSSVAGAWPKDFPLIKVKDTTRALGLLARHYRRKFDIPVIGITGSAGKTTTKEMIAAVLSPRLSTCKNVGTENNQIGVPLTLLKLSAGHQAAVIEMGTNIFGDIPWLTQVACPTMAVLTNIGESHLEQLKTPADVFREKSALGRGVPSGGTVIINADDRFLRSILRRDKRHTVVTFGIEQSADYRASAIEVDPVRGVRFCLNRRYEVRLKSPVLAHVPNALAAIACGRCLGVPLVKMIGALADFVPPSGRHRMINAGGSWIIDDTYNANPVSVRSALLTLAAIKTAGRRVFICGDMLELGPQARPLHAQMGSLAGDLNLDLVLTCGEWSEYISRAARERNARIHVQHYRKITSLNKALPSFCRPGDVVLIKGSRGMRMERVVEELTGYFHQPA